MLKINGSYDIPLPENPINATTPFEAGAQIIHRTNHHNEANTWFVTRVDSLAFGVIGPGGIGKQKCDIQFNHFNSRFKGKQHSKQVLDVQSDLKFNQCSMILQNINLTIMMVS